MCNNRNSMYVCIKVRKFRLILNLHIIPMQRLCGQSSDIFLPTLEVIDQPVKLKFTIKTSVWFLIKSTVSVGISLYLIVLCLCVKNILHIQLAVTSYCTSVIPQYGPIEEMNVCDNLGDHLVGNVYIKVSQCIHAYTHTCTHALQYIRTYICT